MLLLLAVCAMFLAVDINSQPVAAAEVIRNYTGCQSGLPGLIKTMCWIVGGVFSLAGARSIYSTVMRTWDEPSLPDLPKRTWVYFFLAFGFTMLPTMLAFFSMPHCPVPVGTYNGIPLGFPGGCINEVTRADYYRLHLSFIFAYGGALGFYLSYFALSKALRFRNTPAEAALNREAALLLLMSFVMASIPFVWAMGVGVELR
ncbi:MAG: hypothetical protein EPN97_02370 [Alphaproteobacteria bacterium]|nr:MAG: hypothetical protein EPN97_02370 [Alphaproteobacteria bacterium]